MERHIISFKFEGRLADEHSLDASDGVAFHEAARQLLATLAHFYTVGEAPNGGAVNHTKHYRVRETAPKRGSIEFYYLVEVFVVAAVKAAGVGCGIFLFNHFVADAIKQALPRCSKDRGSTWVRDEEVLEYQGGNRQPLIDVETETVQQWDRLQFKIKKSLAGSMRPIGRSADTLTIRIDDWEVTLALEDLVALQVELQQLREDEITLALTALVREGRISGRSTDSNH